MSTSERFGREVARRLGAAPRPDRAAAIRQMRLAEHELQMQRKPRPGWRWRIWGLGTALAGAAALAMVLMVLRPSTEPISAQLRSGAPLEEGARLSAVAGATLMVDFTDGSAVELDPAGEARLVRARADEMRIALAKGKLRASIRPLGRTGWTFEAGPYRVRVVGTQLSVAWDADAQRLDVGVSTGAVRVFGGAIADDGQVVSEGQRLTAVRQRVALQLQEAAAGPGPDAVEPRIDAGVALPDAAPAAVEKNRRGARRRGLPIDPAGLSQWRSLASDGQHAAAIDRAQRLGVARMLRQLGAADLLLLADSARLADRTKIAYRALSAIRARFAGQRQAALAAFRLGRICLERRGKPREAVRWFRSFLREQPDGVLAPDARGRLFTTLAKIGDRTAAQRAAKAYLVRHPDGAYAGQARRLLAP